MNNLHIPNKKQKFQFYCEKCDISAIREVPCVNCDRTCINVIKTPLNRGISRQKREKIHIRDNHKCICCPATTNLTIDHLIPISKGGTNNEWNLATMCSKCNSKKGNQLLPELIQFSNELKQQYMQSELETKLKPVPLSDIEKQELLQRSIDILDDYLNAGSKEQRKASAEKAKEIYKEYYGIDYINRNER
jgi:hypothetical protein